MHTINFIARHYSEILNKLIIPWFYINPTIPLIDSANKMFQDLLSILSFNLFARSLFQLIYLNQIWLLCTISIYLPCLNIATAYIKFNLITALRF